VPGRAIHAYEISPASAHLASASAAKVGLGETYVVHNSCFWEGLKQTPCDCIISNPPYLPAPGEAWLIVGLCVLLAVREPVCRWHGLKQISLGMASCTMS
jgi:hypothetical protein